MDPYAAQIVAASRREDYTREAATERQAGIVRRRSRNTQTEPRSAPRHREAPRPVTA
jgi:hypothetical protein